MRELHPDHDRVVAALTVPELARIIDLVGWAGHDGDGVTFSAIWRGSAAAAWRHSSDGAGSDGTQDIFDRVVSLPGTDL
ncbi:MAG: hypothetical protein LKG20_10515, partial [Tetrasphaera jenkinsii]|nr:hypothetical protein [Tetrasphaera jenkinsii]